MGEVRVRVRVRVRARVRVRVRSSQACSTQSAHIQSALIGCEPPRGTRLVPCGACDR